MCALAPCKAGPDKLVFELHESLAERTGISPKGSPISNARQNTPLLCAGNLPVCKNTLCIQALTYGSHTFINAWARNF